MEMKKYWLKNIRTEWLIMGHLEEKDAIDIVQRSEFNLKSKALNQDQIPIARLVQLPSMSVHEFEQLNYDPQNPNSAVLCQF